MRGGGRGRSRSPSPTPSRTWPPCATRSCPDRPALPRPRDHRHPASARQPSPCCKRSWVDRTGGGDAVAAPGSATGRDPGLRQGQTHARARPVAAPLGPRPTRGRPARRPGATTRQPQGWPAAGSVSDLTLDADGLVLRLTSGRGVYEYSNSPRNPLTPEYRIDHAHPAAASAVQQPPLTAPEQHCPCTRTPAATGSHDRHGGPIAGPDHSEVRPCPGLLGRDSSQPHRSGLSSGRPQGGPPARRRPRSWGR